MFASESPVRAYYGLQYDWGINHPVWQPRVLGAIPACPPRPPPLASTPLPAPLKVLLRLSTPHHGIINLSRREHVLCWLRSATPRPAPTRPPTRRAAVAELRCCSPVADWQCWTGREGEARGSRLAYLQSPGPRAPGEGRGGEGSLLSSRWQTESFRRRHSEPRPSGV